MQNGPQNVHQELNRLRKVVKLVEAIDRAKLAEGLNPHEYADEVAAFLNERGPRYWHELAKEAGCTEPSATTIAAVIATFERRIEKTRAAQRVAQIEAKLNDPTVDPIEKNALEEELMRSWSSEAR